MVNERVDFPRDRWRQARWSPKVWHEQLSLFARLRRLRFDLGADLQGHSKTALCLRLAAPKRRVAARGTDGLARRLNPVVGPGPAHMHTVDWNLEVLRRLDLEIEVPSRPIMPNYTVPDEVRGDGPLVTIAVSAGHRSKAYPVESWRAVGEALVREGWRVAYLGGPTDPPLEHPGALSLVGKLSLDRTIAAVAASELHLASDTGTGHMAAAYGVPVVSVFGPTNPVWYRPYTARGIVLREGKRTEDVRPEAVVEAAMGLYARAIPR